jgi:hypothetical protein
VLSAIGAGPRAIACGVLCRRRGDGGRQLGAIALVLSVPLSAALDAAPGSMFPRRTRSELWLSRPPAAGAWLVGGAAVIPRSPGAFPAWRAARGKRT